MNGVYTMCEDEGCPQHGTDHVCRSPDVEQGIQWERCNQCAGWEQFAHLAYAPINPALPTPSWAIGSRAAERVDLCRKCVAGVPWHGTYRDAMLNKEHAK